MNKELLEIYTDYLISSFGQTTAIRLSEILDNEISHDRISRFLSMSETGSKELLGLVKKTVREVESEDGVLVFDDTIQEKVWTDDNEIITWHYDHCKNRSVKGVNILNCLYHSGAISLLHLKLFVKQYGIVILKPAGRPGKARSQKTSLCVK